MVSAGSPLALAWSIDYHKRELRGAPERRAALAVGRLVEDRTGWSIKKFAHTACRHRTVLIGQRPPAHREDPPTDDLHDALAPSRFGEADAGAVAVLAAACVVYRLDDVVPGFFLGASDVGGILQRMVRAFQVRRRDRAGLQLVWVSGARRAVASRRGAHGRTARLSPRQ